MYRNAEEVLAKLASGGPLGRGLATVGALELRSLAELHSAPIDIRRAYQALQRLAEDSELDIEMLPPRRLAQLADMVRAFRQEGEWLAALAARCAAVAEAGPEVRAAAGAEAAVQQEAA
jgi:hypothetical protein